MALCLIKEIVRCGENGRLEGKSGGREFGEVYGDGERGGRREGDVIWKRRGELAVKR